MCVILGRIAFALSGRAMRGQMRISSGIKDPLMTVDLTATYLLPAWLRYLVQKKCAMAGHSSSVVHYCRDVAEWQKKESLRDFCGPSNSPNFLLTRDTHSPFASSSQISKKTMRSYLQWQGPACGRVMAVSLVAGTALKKIRKRIIQEGTIGVNLVQASS